MINNISKNLAPTGVLRVGLNMSNFLLINSKDAAGLPDGVSPDIGKKLANLASAHQVFCITHLTQVAQKANHHIVIAKNLHDDKTSVSATLLSPEDVTPELKRMAGGDETLLVLK